VVSRAVGNTAGSSSWGAVGEVGVRFGESAELSYEIGDEGNMG